MNNFLTVIINFVIIIYFFIMYNNKQQLSFSFYHSM